MIQIDFFSSTFQPTNPEAIASIGGGKVVEHLYLKLEGGIFVKVNTAKTPI